MASVHPGGRGRRASSAGVGGGGSSTSSNRRNRDEVEEMEPHFPIISGIATSAGGKDYQEDMAVRIDDFNKLIREKSKKFGGSYQVRRSYYAIFDGHGGARCSKFLAENFHVMLAKHILVGERPVEAMEQVWAHIEEKFLELCTDKYKGSGGHDSFHKSGSTATVVFVVGDTVYTANCGDSHAYLFKEGRDPIKYSDDHNTDNPVECERVRATGAKVEQEEVTISKGCCKVEKLRVGKFRVWPGGLAVTRSFGDYSAKLTAFGGVANSILSQFEKTRDFTVVENFGFSALIIASDGAWDALSPEKIWKIFGDTMEKQKAKSWDQWDCVEEACEVICERCCASDFWRQNNYSADNTTVIAMLFKTRPDPVDTATKQEIQEQAEMDAALVAAEKALEGLGMPGDDEEEEEAAPKFRRNRPSVGDSDDAKTPADGAASNEAAADGKQLSASERRKERRKAGEGGAKKSVSFAEDLAP